MPTITVPEGFAAVVVLIAKADDDSTIDIKFVNGDEGIEHLYAADAIAALAGYQADEIDELLEGGGDAEGEGDES